MEDYTAEKIKKQKQTIIAKPTKKTRKKNRDSIIEIFRKKKKVKKLW